MHKLLLTLLALVTLGAVPSVARASGCYVCAGGSAPSCKDYCQYQGADTFDNRHKCQAKGCKISGTSPCPDPSAKAQVCLDERQEAVRVALIPWCVAPGRS